MKYQILFSGGKNKENISLSSVDFAQRVIKENRCLIILSTQMHNTIFFSSAEYRQNALRMSYLRHISFIILPLPGGELFATENRPSHIFSKKKKKKKSEPGTR